MTELRPLADRIVGLSEIADLYTISPQLADRWSQHKAFPKPLRELKQGRVWDVREVDAWAGTYRQSHAADRRRAKRG